MPNTDDTPELRWTNVVLVDDKVTINVTGTFALNDTEDFKVVDALRVAINIACEGFRHNHD